MFVFGLFNYTTGRYVKPVYLVRAEVHTIKESIGPGQLWKTKDAAIIARQEVRAHFIKLIESWQQTIDESRAKIVKYRRSVDKATTELNQYHNQPAGEVGELYVKAKEKLSNATAQYKNEILNVAHYERERDKAIQYQTHDIDVVSIETKRAEQIC